MAKKYKVLAWGDAATAGTGFGTVSKHVLSAIWNTGKYDIDHLAINFNGDFDDSGSVPWQMQPARLLNPRDPHGIEMFKKTALKGNYDIIWILNDIYVTHKAAESVQEVRTLYKSNGRKPPVFIYYYPIDCQCSPWATGMLEAVDLCVCYTKHGREETIKTIPHIMSKMVEIPHGVDTANYKPVSLEQRNAWKQKYWNLSPDTKLVINVNRNSVRKQIPYSILAFKEFRKKYPNSVLYLHMMVLDQGGNLAKAINHAGLDPRKDVLMPAGFSPANPLPVEVLSRMYCAADVFLTTHLGEGWGLTITEAMATGTPVVAPRNTCMPQQLGEDSERGYMYECKDTIMVDDSGYRLKGLLPDIADSMISAVEDGKDNNPKVEAALQFAKAHDWETIGSKWVALFDKAIRIKEKASVDLAEEL